MRFSVCLIAPETYKYSHFLYDTCKYYCYTIEAAGHECCMVRNHLYSDRINIIIGAHNITDPASVEQIRNAGKYVVLQSEVLTEDSIAGWPVQESYAKIYLPLLRRADAVWDSLESNQRQLKKFGIDADLHSRVGYLSAMEEITHKKNKDIDFLYYGSVTPHRKKLLDELQKRGGKIVCVFDEAAIFRNDLIARARVNLAPNQAPRVDHLSSRVLYLLNNRAIVVAERCYNQDWVEHCFLSASTEEWADVCMETIRRPDLDQLAEKYFEQYKKLDVVHLIKPLIEKLACSLGSTLSCKSPADTSLHEKRDLHEDFGNASSSAMKTDGTSMGMTSIIMATVNQLQHTKKCIESINKNTPEPHEIVFIDNASTDGTVKWLRKIVRENANYRLIENHKNLGFAKACNQGIEVSSGEYVMLLNSDAVVTENWLSGMLECLNSASDTGIVGPMTNNINSSQNVPDADYKTMNRMHDYAKSFRGRYRYRRVPLRRIAGFCMLFSRQLANKIGLLDESFGADNLGDDYCLRATLAGFRNLVAGDVFIHHYGSRSFIGNVIDYSASMAGNIKIFDEKWTGIAVDTPLGKKVAAYSFIDKADKLNQRGQLNKSIGMLIEGIKYAPEDKALYYPLAEMLLDDKHYKDALEAVNSMPPDAKDDLKRLEIIAYCTEDLEAASKDADRILGIDKAYAPAWNLKGIIAFKRGDNAAAEGFFRHAIAADPGYGAPYTNRGMLKWESDQKEEALDLLEKGFILSPTTTDSVTLYHSAITALEQFNRSEQIFQDAKELHQENKRVLFFLIDILIKQGRFERAMHEVERAMLNIGIDDGMLPAALAIREKVGIMEIDKAVKNKGTLSLCMIVKDEERHLARCLLSAGPVVDEMIIVDTGSTDRTKDIARAYGAKVFDFPWTNDFSEARNYSLSKAAGDWVLVLDADEVISPQDYAEFERIVKNRPAKPVAYIMITRNYTYEVTSKGWTANDRKYLNEEDGTGWFPSSKVRLFVNDKRIRFQNPVHEFVEESLEKARIEIKVSAIPVHHYGRFDKDKIMEKGKKYFLLGKKKIKEMKGDIKALRELAIQACELGEFDTSVELWKEVIELNQNDPDAFLNIGYAYLKLEKYREALDSSRRATELDPSMKEAALNYAGSEFLIGDIRKTISILETLLQKDPDYPSAMLLVAAAYYVKGDKEKGLEFFEKLRKRGFNWTNFLDEHSRGLI